MKSLSLVLLFIVIAVTSPAAGEFASAKRAADFVHALQIAGMDAFAASDPAEEGRFVAALFVPGQLLVVSAKHPSAAAVRQRIAAGMYRDVYLDLQGTPTTEGKFFVQDSQADGLLNATRGGGGVDVVYFDGARTLLFNGNPRAQHLSDEQYDAAFDDADSRYAQMLEVLDMAFKSPR
jgi:hypothetical protein